MKFAAVLAFIVAILCGCTRLVDDPAPVKEPRTVDCDLIFPGPGGA
jgi:hypothetical protein